MNSSDKQFEQRMRALYHEATQNVDPVTAGRLRAARRTALASGTHDAGSRRRARVLLPAGALAAVALATLMILQPAPQPQAVGTPQVNVAPEQDNSEYLPPGAEKADPGLYQNLDFYSWLAANDGNQTKR
jgi:hypothetical protein